MANQEHVELTKRGAGAIALWRRDHSGEVLNLEGADLSGADLTSAILSGANLAEAKLKAANLTRSFMIGSNMQNADLSGAILERAELGGSSMIGTKLCGANLTKCSLFSTRMMFSDLSEANLTEANLSFAMLSWALLNSADFTRAEFGSTVLSAVTLAYCTGLETAVHRDSSSVSHDTLEMSFRSGGNRFAPELKTFFVNAGVPKSLLEELPRIFAMVEYCSCFICYGEPDVAFARKLAKSLKARGVSCWLYALDGTPGERTWPEIIRRRREAEKMIVICSCRTLVRDGALKEIEEQIDEEPSKIVPVSLDNTWKEPGFVVKRGQRDLKPVLLDRNYADFGGKTAYGKSLNRLLVGLKRAGS